MSRAFVQADAYSSPAPFDRSVSTASGGRTVAVRVLAVDPAEA